MIYELLTVLRRKKRYHRISELITGIITAESQKRVDKSLTEAYLRSTAQGVTPEQGKEMFNQELIEKINGLLAVENARRVRQWTEAIMEEEDRFLFGR